MNFQRLTTLNQPRVAARRPVVRTILTYTALIVTVSVLPQTALAKQSKTPARSSVQDKGPAGRKIEDLPNFHQVHPFLYRSGEPTRKGLDKLAEMGVKTIIDLRSKGEMDFNEAQEAEKRGLEYINLVMSDKAPTEKQVETMLKTIDQAKETGEPVLVHCAHGSDRTGSMIGIYRVTRDDWNFDDTYKEMRKYYFGPKYHQLRDAVRSRVGTPVTESSAQATP